MALLLPSFFPSPSWWSSSLYCSGECRECLSNVEIPAFARICPGGRSLAQQPQFPEVSMSVRLSYSVQQFAGSSCARCSLSPALNYAVTLPCLFRFNCYKLKWIAKLVWFFKAWRVSGSNEFLLVCCYLGMLLRIWVATVGKRKMIWNVLAGEKWCNLQASNNNIYIWCKLLEAKSLSQRGLSSGVQSGCKCAHLWIAGFYFFMLH